MKYQRKSEDWIMDAFSLELDEAGHVKSKEENAYIPTNCGRDSIRIDKVAAFKHDEEAPAGTVAVCDDRIGCMLDHVKDLD